LHQKWTQRVTGPEPSNQKRGKGERSRTNSERKNKSSSNRATTSFGAVPAWSSSDNGGDGGNEDGDEKGGNRENRKELNPPVSNGEGGDEDEDESSDETDDDNEDQGPTTGPNGRNWVHMLIHKSRATFKQVPVDISDLLDDSKVAVELNGAFREHRGIWRAATMISRIRLTKVISRFKTTMTYLILVVPALQL
jgi:hypothetical protein